MSRSPVGSSTGIFTLFFREAGAFWEQAFTWAEQQAREDRLLDAEEDKRRLSNAQYLKADAEARLLEQIRLAKEAGLDVDDILRRIREELR
jgi:hypothetical protein